MHSTLKGEQDCASKCERSLHYRERVCVSVRDNMIHFVFAGSLLAFEGDCLYMLHKIHTIFHFGKNVFFASL